MKAALLYGLKDLRLEEVAIPDLGESDLLIKIAFNGLCGTDASEYAKGALMVPLANPHPNSGHHGATILGHEFVGEVVKAGSAVEHMLGKRVACGAGVSCGNCSMCHQGRTNLCDSYYTLGLSTHGGLAEFAVAPAKICIPIPDSCSTVHAALAQPLAVGIHAVKRAQIKSGDRVFLLGVGAIGSFVCVALGKLGVEIVAADISQERLDVAIKLGASRTVLLPKELTPQEAKTLFGGQAEVVFETSGVPGAIARAIALTKMGGTCMLLGLNKSPQEIVFADPVLREVTLQTTVAHVCQDDIPEALEILSDGQVATLLTGPIFPLESTLEAFSLLVSGGAQGKILVSSL